MKKKKTVFCSLHKNYLIIYVNNELDVTAYNEGCYCMVIPLHPTCGCVTFNVYRKLGATPLHILYYYFTNFKMFCLLIFPQVYTNYFIDAQQIEFIKQSKESDFSALNLKFFLSVSSQPPNSNLKNCQTVRTEKHYKLLWCFSYLLSDTSL